MRKMPLVAVIAMAAALVLVPGAQAQGITFTDSAGTRISLTSRAKRIISLSPAITEMVYAAGAGQTLVGNTTYCNYPPDAASKSKVGGFSARSVSLESIIALAPDLVLGELGMHGELAGRFAKAGIVTALFQIIDFGGIYSAIERIGEVAGDLVVAGQTVASMKRRFDALAAKTAKLPLSERPTVFWEVWDDPVMSAGPETFTSRIIELAGGRNVFVDAKQDWPVVSVEEVLKRNPDVIMSPRTHGERLTLEKLARRPGWSSLAAVRKNRIYFFDDDMSSRPGPRLLDAAEQMAAVLDGIKAGR